jgi:hypothetical protein
VLSCTKENNLNIFKSKKYAHQYPLTFFSYHLTSLVPDDGWSVHLKHWTFQKYLHGLLPESSTTMINTCLILLRFYPSTSFDIGENIHHILISHPLYIGCILVCKVEKSCSLKALNLPSNHNILLQPALASHKAT